MALPSPGFVIVKLNDSSTKTQVPKISINFKLVQHFKASIIIQNPISTNPNSNSTRCLYVCKLNCSKSDNLGNMSIVTEVFDSKIDRDSDDDEDNGNGNGNGNVPPPGGNGGGHGGGEDDDDEKEFGPLMKFDEVIKVVESRGVSLPADMLEAAKATGLRKLILNRYLDLQGSGFALGFLTRNFAMFRNRMLADPSFLFKVGTEIVIDSCCATFAEVQKRGKDFWDEFELYAADILVGIVLDIALVGMLAPYARIGKQSVASGGVFAGLKNSVAALPSSVFEFERPGSRFSVQQRLATYFYKGLLYGSVGFGCGLIGQGIMNMIMNAKRRMNTSEDKVHNVRVPPLVQSAVLWGVFLAVSSNTRYQVINGLESLVETSPLTKQVPLVAMAFTIGVRFANNIYGGMQFVDWARRSGVQ